MFGVSPVELYKCNFEYKTGSNFETDIAEFVPVKTEGFGCFRFSRV